MPLTVSMVTLGVSSMADSVRFYSETLKLDLQHQFEGFAIFSAGPIQLVLNAPLGRAVEPRPGATEVVFTVESVKAAWADLAARGCQFINTPRLVNGNSWAATFQDPDGHRLTLFGPE